MHWKKGRKLEKIVPDIMMCQHGHDTHAGTGCGDDGSHGGTTGCSDDEGCKRGIMIDQHGGCDILDLTTWAPMSEKRFPIPGRLPWLKQRGWLAETLLTEIMVGSSCEVIIGLSVRKTSRKGNQRF